MTIVRLRICLVYALFTALTGCGGASGRADVTPESMPAGGTYTGVWFSPQYGEMHLEQNGSTVIGEYTKDDRAGKIQGTVQGNLLRFAWTEERELVVGRSNINRGRGYFRYVLGDDGRHNILGEWGIDDAEYGGGPWNAYKLRNRRPQIAPPESTGATNRALEDDYRDDGAEEEPADLGIDDQEDGAGADDALEGLDEY